MSTDSAHNPSPQDSVIELNDENVADYLRKHPDFFNQQDDLLLSLRIPHKSGSAISLVERQISLLRESNQALKVQLNRLLSNASANDQLFEKTRKMMLDLLKADNLPDLISVLQERIIDDFDASDCQLIFFSADNAGKDFPRTENSTQAQSTLGDLFEKTRTFCGELQPAQAAFLFNDLERPVVSAAIIPLHLAASCPLGESAMLAIGSAEPSHFNKDLDTLFLDFLGEVITSLLPKCQAS